MLLCYSDFSLTNADLSSVRERNLRVYETGESSRYDVQTFFSCFMGLLGYENAILGKANCLFSN